MNFLQLQARLNIIKYRTSKIQSNIKGLDEKEIKDIYKKLESVAKSLNKIDYENNL